MNLEKAQYPYKAYVILGINENNPDDIIGYCENSFSMSWSNRYVNIWDTISEKEMWKSARKELQSRIDEKWEGVLKNLEQLQKEGLSYEEAFEHEAKKHLSIYMLPQNEYNHVRHYPTYIPKGYRLAVFRVGSKHCPIDIDLRYRIAYRNRKETFWDKWKFRNPPFFVKSLNKNNWKWSNIKYSDWLHRKFPNERFFDKSPMTKIPYTDLSKKEIKNEGSVIISRSDRQKLKKQKRNSKR